MCSASTSLLFRNGRSAQAAALSLLPCQAPGRRLGVRSHTHPNGKETQDPDDFAELVRAFHIGGDRVFDDDPRFGLVVLSQIAGRALSPAVNDLVRRSTL
jgi:hypothetical protein